MDIFAKANARRSPTAPTPLNKAADRLDLIARGKPKRDPVAKEIARITSLPLVLPVTPEEVEAFCRENVLAEAFHRGWRLFPQQVGAVLAYDLYDGGFFPIGVGAGKTLISLMIAESAYRAKVQQSLLLVPSSVYSQLISSGISYARRHVPISVPFHKLGGTTKSKRLAFARSGRPGCYILPYSCLSTQDSSELLERINPSLIIADEAHLLKNFKAARTKRVRHFMDHRMPGPPQMVAMSGTITSKSISDYWHVIRACLRENCPLPMSGHVVRQWGQVLDADSAPTWGDSYGDDGFRTEPVMPLVRWAQKHFPEQNFPETTSGFRSSYQLRLKTAPGVVMSSDHEIGTSLVLRNDPPALRPEPDGWQDLQALIKEVQVNYKAPNGDEIDHAIHQFGWMYQLSAGFYNDLYWPAAEVLSAERPGLSVDRAEELLDDAKWHHKLLQIYHSTLRKWLSHRSKPGMDTPFLVGSEMSTNGARNVGSELYEAWLTAKEAAFDNMPKRRKRPVRVCDYKIRAAVKWALSEVPTGRGAVLWYWNGEIGKWLYEALQTAGMAPGSEVVMCPRGQNDTIRKIGDPEMGGKGDKFAVASIGAHHVGKDLFAWQHEYMLQWPRVAMIAEQLLGRLHRTGQQADELVVVTNNLSDFDHMNFAACLNDACYIHQTTVRQKLMYASYDPAPVVVDPAVLRKKGFDPKKLTGEQLQLLRETFGDLRS